MFDLGVWGKSKRAAEPPPNLVYINELKSQKVILRGIKCKCNKSWCPICSLKTVINRFCGYVKDWDWRRVRHITLTIDPSLFESPEAAYDLLVKKKKIAGMIRNIGRTLEKVVVDWCWLLEWHRNELPHWHLFVLVDKAGYRGQIGADKIRHYWTYGRIEEKPIKSESHWKKMTDYLSKHGYFQKDKAHQSRLPEWVRERKSIIKRFGRMNKSRGNEGSRNEKLSESNNEFDKLINESKLCEWFERKESEQFTKTQGQLLDDCGNKTDVYWGLDGFKNFWGRLDMPYHEFKCMDGKYMEGLGYVVEMDRVKLELLRARHFLCSVH